MKISIPINQYIDILKKAELATSIYHNYKFSQSGIPIYNIEVFEKWQRKRKRWRRKAIARRYALQANATMISFIGEENNFYIYDDDGDDYNDND